MTNDVVVSTDYEGGSQKRIEGDRCCAGLPLTTASDNRGSQKRIEGLSDSFLNATFHNRGSQKRIEGTATLTPILESVQGGSQKRIEGTPQGGC